MASSAPEYQHLLSVSAAIGSDPLLVQGAGGNTSVKIDDVLWIKASGTWLMNANSQNIMVPVKLSELRAALDSNAEIAERAESCVVSSLNTNRLRPSIETTFHAIFPQKVVLHVHCVETISVAVRQNAEALLEPLLENFNWCYVPYAKPGIDLSRVIAERLYDSRGNINQVMILGNHGLVVAEDSVDAAHLLLQRVCTALRQEVRTPKKHHDLGELDRLARGSDYGIPSDVQVHAVALDDCSLDVASGGSLYPDHVIFLGAGSVVARQDESASDTALRCTQSGQPEPVSILFPGIGVLMRNGASDGANAMARCLSDVCARVVEGSSVNYLTSRQNHELLNWDAEKYRQAVNNGNDIR